MGASCWTYFVPYRPDVEQALQELRRSVFEAGGYYKPSEFRARIARESFAAGQLTREELELRLAQIAAAAEPEPKSIDELIDQRAEEMTHSIIDIEHVCEEDDFQAVSLLSPERHEELLGTLRPTRALLEEDEVQSALFDLLDRGCAHYLIVYADDRPHELFFVGVTGD